MQRFVLISLLGLLGQAHAEDESTNKVASKLLERTSMHQDGQNLGLRGRLDEATVAKSATMAKPGSLAVAPALANPPAANRLAPAQALRSFQVGRVRHTAQKTKMFNGPSVAQLEKRTSLYKFDCKGEIVGRAASRIAMIARGKHQVFFTPGINPGNIIIVENAGLAVMTGNKADRNKGKFYWYHGRKLGTGKKWLTAGKIFESNRPELVMEKAIRGMIPRTKLGKQEWMQIKVYPYEAPADLTANAKDIKEIYAARDYTSQASVEYHASQAAGR